MSRPQRTKHSTLVSATSRTKSCKPCKKVSFKDEIAAKIALAGRSRKDKGEVRCYKCPEGHGWHLTSKKQRQP